MDYEVKGRNVAERAANNRGSWAAVVVLAAVLTVALTMRNELLLMAQSVWATLSTLARVFLLLLGVLCAVGFFATIFGLLFGLNTADSAAYQVNTLVGAEDDDEAPVTGMDPMRGENISGYDSNGNPMGMHRGQISV